MKAGRHLLILSGLLLPGSCFALCWPQIKPLKPPEPTVSLAAVGDILLDRGVGEKIQQHGLAYPFQHVGSTLATADLTFGNLECPLSAHGTKVVKPFVFKAKPETAQCLTAAGFDLLSLANNHTLDCGRRGLVETMDILRQHDILYCGAGTDAATARAPTIMKVKGLKIAFVGFCDFLPEGVFMRDDKPTITLATVERVERAVAVARQQAAVVVASFHWGIEYDSRPSQRQRELAHAAVKAGADLVLGHHPHVLQGFEVVDAPTGRKALISYSLGNFVFDSPQRWTQRTSNSMILRCRLSRRGVAGAEIVPVKIVEYRPRPATTPESAAILTRLKQLSGELKTVITGGTVHF